MARINKTMPTILALIACEVAIQQQITKQTAIVQADKEMGPEERNNDLALFERQMTQSKKRQGWWEADRTRLEQALEKQRAEQAKAALTTPAAAPRK